MKWLVYPQYLVEPQHIEGSAFYMLLQETWSRTLDYAADVLQGA